MIGCIGTYEQHLWREKTLKQYILNMDSRGLEAGGLRVTLSVVFSDFLKTVK